jgi:hypothetical protein
MTIQTLKLPSLALALLLASGSAFTQTAAPAPSSPAKKELVTRILKLQQPSIESLARQLAEQPAAQLLSRAGAALPSRVAADKREAVAKEIQADAKKYADEAVPLVRARALKLAPTTVGSVLETKLSEEELTQVVALLESPAYKKYMELTDDMQNALLEKLVADTRGTIEPKVKALEASIGKRLGLPATPPAK